MKMPKVDSLKWVKQLCEDETYFKKISYNNFDIHIRGINRGWIYDNFDNTSSIAKIVLYDTESDMYPLIDDVNLDTEKKSLREIKKEIKEKLGGQYIKEIYANDDSCYQHLTLVTQNKDKYRERGFIFIDKKYTANNEEWVADIYENALKIASAIFSGYELSYLIAWKDSVLHEESYSYHEEPYDCEDPSIDDFLWETTLQKAKDNIDKNYYTYVETVNRILEENFKYWEECSKQWKETIKE